MYSMVFMKGELGPNQNSPRPRPEGIILSALRLKTIFYFFTLMSADSMSAVKLHSVERRSSHIDCMGGPTESGPSSVRMCFTKNGIIY